MKSTKFASLQYRALLRNRDEDAATAGLCPTLSGTKSGNQTLILNWDDLLRGPDRLGPMARYLERFAFFDKSQRI